MSSFNSHPKLNVNQEMNCQEQKEIKLKKKKQNQKEQHHIHTLEQILVVFYLINENLP